MNKKKKSVECVIDKNIPTYIGPQNWNDYVLVLRKGHGVR